MTTKLTIGDTYRNHLGAELTIDGNALMDGHRVIGDDIYVARPSAVGFGAIPCYLVTATSLAGAGYERQEGDTP